MQGKFTWILAAAIAALALIAVGYFAWPTDSRERQDGPGPGEAESSSSADSGGAPFLNGAANGGAPLPADEAALIEQLRAKFAPHIGSKHAQIKLIEQLMRYAQQRYPGDWRARLRALLQQLFPELAADIYARFGKLEAHNRWLAENRHALNQMSPAQRRDTLWAARHEAFGADAEEIWAGARRAEQLQDALAALDAFGDATPAQKMDRFVAAIHETYGDDAAQFIEMRQTELLGSFLAVNSVQQELRALPAAQRSATLRALRESIGMDDAAIARWDELDRSRDAAWDAGQRYMAERAAILAVGAPETQSQQLQQLRAQTFGAEEAAIIASEEAAGFYRFGQERRIGRE